jgi:hypothetical protein
MSQFERYIGIDYSGAETPNSPLKGLRVYCSEDVSMPNEVPPPPNRKHWSRREIAEWLVCELHKKIPTFVGIDHGFSFPLRYFDQHQLALNWDAFLIDFQKHWPTDTNIYVDFVRDGAEGNGAARMGHSRWRRLTEERSIKAKSVFHFDVPGSVAKSTHAGLPWLLHIRKNLGDRIHFWPFDGWTIPEGRSVIAESYPALWSKYFPIQDRTQDQHDAFSIAAWVSRTDHLDGLASVFTPDLSEADQATARIEGWILGV